MAFALMISICVNSTVKAQSPADDPGIGGVGSPTGGGLTGDGGPIVPFNNNLNVLFLSSAVGAIFLGYKKGIIAVR